MPNVASRYSSKEVDDDGEEKPPRKTLVARPNELVLMNNMMMMMSRLFLFFVTAKKRGSNRPRCCYCYGCFSLSFVHTTYISVRVFRGSACSVYVDVDMLHFAKLLFAHHSSLSLDMDN
jgi:hypothetical protein